MAVAVVVVVAAAAAAAAVVAVEVLVTVAMGNAGMQGRGQEDCPWSLCLSTLRGAMPPGRAY